MHSLLQSELQSDDHAGLTNKNSKAAITTLRIEPLPAIEFEQSKINSRSVTRTINRSLILLIGQENWHLWCFRVKYNIQTFAFHSYIKETALDIIDIIKGVFGSLPAIATVVVGWYAISRTALFARWNKIAEFRHSWITDLRIDVSAYMGAALTWTRAYQKFQSIEDRNYLTAQELYKAESDMRMLYWKIALRLNPSESSSGPQEKKFLDNLLKLVDPAALGPEESDKRWLEIANEVSIQTREILKKEWEAVKSFEYAPKSWLGR